MSKSDTEITADIEKILREFTNPRGNSFKIIPLILTALGPNARYFKPKEIAGLLPKSNNQDAIDVFISDIFKLRNKRKDQYNIANNRNRIKKLKGWIAVLAIYSSAATLLIIKMWSLPRIFETRNEYSTPSIIVTKSSHSSKIKSQHLSEPADTTPVSKSNPTRKILVPGEGQSSQTNNRNDSTTNLKKENKTSTKGKNNPSENQLEELIQENKNSDWH